VGGFFGVASKNDCVQDLFYDLVTAIGLPKEKTCTYCWDGADVK
jgi:hypothetical protein